MPFTPAKCTNCGADLEVDASKEAAICPYCQTAYIVEKAINNYNQTNTVYANKVDISAKGDAEKERLLKNAETYKKLGNISEAKRILESVTKDYPDDYRGWYGLATIEVNEYYNYIDSELLKYRNRSDSDDRYALKNDVETCIVVDTHNLARMIEIDCKNALAVAADDTARNEIQSSLHNFRKKKEEDIKELTEIKKEIEEEYRKRMIEHEIKRKEDERSETKSAVLGILLLILLPILILFLTIKACT